MTQAIKNQISNVTHDMERLFYILAGAAFVFVCLYGYFVQQTIVNVVAREKALKATQQLNSELGTLEGQYMALSNTVTLDLAYAHGFINADVSEYIPRSLGATSLTYNQ